MTTLTRPQIVTLAQAKFPDPENVAIAVAVCLAESAGVVEAMNDNYPRWQTAGSVYRYDDGLMQINSVWGYDRSRLRSDADYNMGAARYIWDVQGWRAWSTYNSGAYLAFYVPPPQAPPSPVPAGFFPDALVRLEIYARTRGLAGSGVGIVDMGDHYEITVKK